MITNKNIFDLIDQMAPFNTAEPWDNVGLLIGSMSEPVNNIMIALDVTSSVIDEAIANKVDLIITHHPIIFSALKSIKKESLVYKLISNNISVISAHTNLDISLGGINDTLAEIIGLTDIQPLSIVNERPVYKIIVFVPKTHIEFVYNAMKLSGAGTEENYSGCAFISTGEGRFIPEKNANPTIGKNGELEIVEEVKLEMIAPSHLLNDVIVAMKNAHPYEVPAYDIFENYGLTYKNSIGRIGKLSSVMSPKELAKHIKLKLNAPIVRYLENVKTISSVAVCSGSGGDFLDSAIKLRADAYLTGEIPHHKILEAQENGICVLEAGHFSTENIFMEPLKKHILDIIPSATVLLSKQCTDGIKAI